MNTDLNEIEQALSYIDSNDRDIWIRVGSALKTELGEDGFFPWNEWSKTGSNYDEKTAKSNWKSFRPGKVDIETLFYFAKQGGYGTKKNPNFIKNAMNNLAKKSIEEQKLKQAQDRLLAKEKSNRIWNRAQPVNNHAYLKKKNISNPIILRKLRQITILGNNLLLIPICNINGEIQSLQYINEDGTKRFTPNGETKGHFFLLGDEKQAHEEVILTEGLATASSIYEASGKPVLITFNADNMISVAEELAKNNFSKNYTLAIDNDFSTTEFNKVLQVQKFLPGAKIISPSFNKKELEQFQEKYHKFPLNFNDLHLLSGLDRVKQQFHLPITHQGISMFQTQFQQEMSHQQNILIESLQKEIDYVYSQQSEKLAYEKEIDLSEIDLSEIDLSEIDLSEINLSEIDLSEIDDIEADELQNGIEPASPELSLNKNQSREYIEEITLEQIQQKEKIQEPFKEPGFEEKELTQNATNQDSILDKKENNTQTINKILDLNYEIPAAIQNICIIKNGNFLNKNNNLQFKDFGNKIKTQKIDEKTIRNMLDITQTKNWDQIKIKGSREFKLTAWLIASERGIEISGFKPNDKDLKILDKISQSFTNTVQQEKTIHQQAQQTNQQTKSVEPIINTKQELYKVVDFGAANYQFDEKNNLNFYLKLEKNGVETILWDKELAEAIIKAEVNRGDCILSAERVGKKLVKVRTNEYDENGEFIGRKEIDTYKNIWKIEKPALQKKEILQEKNNYPIKLAVSQNLQKTEKPLLLVTHIKKSQEHYQVIEMGHGINDKGEKSFFLKLEKDNNQKTFWGNELQKEIKAQKIHIGDQIVNINLQNGQWTITPAVQIQNKQQVQEQIKTETEHEKNTPEKHQETKQSGLE